MHSGEREALLAEPAGVHLGMRLIRTLVQQLHGTLSTPDSDGTTLEVEFPTHSQPLSCFALMPISAYTA